MLSNIYFNSLDLLNKICTYLNLCIFKTEVGIFRNSIMRRKSIDMHNMVSSFISDKMSNE